jgi:hypothetical protein
MPSRLELRPRALANAVIDAQVCAFPFSPNRPPDVHCVSALPEVPGFHCVSLLPEVPGFHCVSALPEVPGFHLSALPEVPGFHCVSALPEVPGFHCLSALPEVAGFHCLSALPEVPGFPPGRLRLSQGASLKPDESEGCSPVSGGRTIRLCSCWPSDDPPTRQKEDHGEDRSAHLH